MVVKAVTAVLAATAATRARSPPDPPPTGTTAVPAGLAVPLVAVVRLELVRAPPAPLATREPVARAVTAGTAAQAPTEWRLVSAALAMPDSLAAKVGLAVRVETQAPAAPTEPAASAVTVAWAATVPTPARPTRAPTDSLEAGAATVVTLEMAAL
jgi:hypothetical protein